MKWETIKKRVKAGVRYMIYRSESPEILVAMLVDVLVSDFKVPGVSSLRELREVYADEACRMIDKWDIRMVGRLRELFPGSWPPSLQKGDLIGELDDSGEWILRKA
jgi:hypothetical protein